MKFALTSTFCLENAVWILNVRYPCYLIRTHVIVVPSLKVPTACATPPCTLRRPMKEVLRQRNQIIAFMHSLLICIHPYISLLRKVSAAILL